MTRAKDLRYRTHRWSAIAGVIVGLLIGAPGVVLVQTLAHTRAEAVTNCRQINLLKTTIRATIHQGDELLSKPGTAGYAYYYAHPAELRQAHAQNLTVIRAFHSLPCR